MTELADLVGEHILDGVDFYTEKAANKWEDDANACRFRLDGTIYCAVEDPSDGYRSSMREIFVVKGDVDMENTFPPVKVVGRYKDRKGSSYSSRECDILELVDVVTGEVVLEVGTDRTDDYYPSFVTFFNPRAMSVNSAVPEETPPVKPEPGPNRTRDNPLFGRF